MEVEKAFYEAGKWHTKIVNCDVRVNHAYKDGKFVKRTTFDGKPWDYQEHDFVTPVCSVVGNNGVGEFVEKEFKRMFQEQRKEEGW